MDSEYDKNVARVLVTGNMSKSECDKTGVSFDKMKRNIKKLNAVLTETENAKLAAEDLMNLRLTEKKFRCQKRLDEAEEKLKIHKDNMKKDRREELEQKILVMKTSLNEIDELLSRSSPGAIKKLKKMEKRIYLALLQSNRVKKRKVGQGPREKYTEEDERYVAQIVEEHASVDGRRKESCLYFARRFS